MTLDAEYPKSQMEAMPEFFDFEYGGVHERYTSWSQDLTFLGYNFGRAPIHRSGFQFDEKFSAIRVTVKAPISSGFERFVSDAPLEPTSITIYRALKSDLTEYAIIFTGTIINVSFADRIAQAQCESNSTILNYTTPRIVYQSYCNHELFDSNCGLDWTNYIINATVTVGSDSTGSYLDSATFDTYDDGYFKLGRIIFGADERMITKHLASKVYLHMPFASDLVNNTEIQALPGCDGAPATCKAFSNFDDHFLGFCYVPNTNPVYWGA
jgi:uncharacterized phage protein (TIGR02218 family)